ncbi:aminopeptidase Ey-like [Babylonia areolata]|uniref:aminopeptidase Ey-like n=1 Tax=Babylonia areolata TaxID=304850 RepID=UPI003FD1907B
MHDFPPPVTIFNQSIPGPEEEDGWLLGNIGCYGFYRVNYDESNWRALITQLNTDHTKISLANRAQILMDSWSLARAGQLSYTVALSTLGYLQKETQHVAWRAALTEMHDLQALLSADRTVFELFSTFMQRQTASIFDSFDPKSALSEDADSRTAVLVTQTACHYGLKACVRLARAQFDQWRTHPDNNTVTVDMRSAFYCTAVAHGSPSDWDFLFQRYLREVKASERARLRLALACARDSAILNTLINRTLDQTYIPTQDALETLIACAGNRYGRDLVWAFVRYNLPVIRERFSSTAFNMKGLFSGISQSFHTTQQLMELEDLASRYPDLSEAMVDAIEKTRANREWLRHNLVSIQRWLLTQMAD